MRTSCRWVGLPHGRKEDSLENGVRRIVKARLRKAPVSPSTWWMDGVTPSISNLASMASTSLRVDSGGQAMKVRSRSTLRSGPTEMCRASTEPLALSTSRMSARMVQPGKRRVNRPTISCSRAVIGWYNSRLHLCLENGAAQWSAASLERPTKYGACSTFMSAALTIVLAHFQRRYRPACRPSPTHSSTSGLSL